MPRNYRKHLSEPAVCEESVAALKTLAVKQDFARLFNGTRLFDPENCARRGCDRTPAPGSRFCGCCLEDMRAGRVVVFDGREELLPGGTVMERHAYGGEVIHEWNHPRN